MVWLPGGPARRGPGAWAGRSVGGVRLLPQTREVVRAGLSRRGPEGQGAGARAPASPRAWAGVAPAVAALCGHARNALDVTQDSESSS